MSDRHQLSRAAWRRWLGVIIAMTMTVLAVTGPLAPAGNASPTATSPGGNSLAVTPPMGFNNWARFGCTTDKPVKGDVGPSETLILNQANALVTSGLAAKGYTTVTVDDCWMTGTRDASGNLVANSATFPSGMKSIGDKLHALGLRFGLYEDIGLTTCGGFAGSWGHFQQDVDTFASWGVDYIKLDGCNIPSALKNAAGYAAAYSAFGAAMKRNASGRDMVFSESSPAYFFIGNSDLSDWYTVTDSASRSGQLWRTGYDVTMYNYPDANGNPVSAWNNPTNDAGILTQYDYNSKLSRYSAPGDWNDPDFLITGDHLTDDESRTQVALWSMMASPLNLSTDITSLSAASLATLRNSDVIAIDQDPLGTAAGIVSQDGTIDVLSRPLANGDRAVALLNRSNASASAGTTTSAAGFLGGSGCTYSVKDLWKGTTSSISDGAISAGVLAPHSTAIYRITPGGGCTKQQPAGQFTGIGGSCLDDQNSGTTAGNPIDLSHCTAKTNQSWTVPGDGTVRTLGECLDAVNHTAVLDPCNGGADQTWAYQRNGFLKNTGLNLCLEVNAATTTAPPDGTPIVLDTCAKTETNQMNQVWALPGVPTAPAPAKPPLAMTPPMGWNHWAHFGCAKDTPVTGDVGPSGSLILQQADALVSSGLAAKGYDTVTIDGCWMNSARNAATGLLEPDTTKFPNQDPKAFHDEMAYIGVQLHQKGLKFGIYESAGSAQCNKTAGGSQYNWTNDAILFAAWGVDYLKLDGCGVTVPSGWTEEQAYLDSYSKMSQALRDTGRDITFSESAPAYFQGTTDYNTVLGWVGQYGQLWRTGTDIEMRQNPATTPQPTRWWSVLGNYGYNNPLHRYVHPGNWNDPDFVIAGDSQLTQDESRSQLSLWAMMAAPLILSDDVTTLSQSSIADLGNADVLAVDQDPLGQPGYVVSQTGTQDIMTRPLADGDRAVAVLNRTDAAVTTSTSAAAIGFTGGSGCSYTVKYLWSGASSTTPGPISAQMQPHGTAMMRVHPSAGCGAVQQVGQISGFHGYCLDSGTTGNPVQLSTCAGTPSQSWTLPGDGTVRQGSMCLDVPGSTAGTKVDLAACNGSTGQQWPYPLSGALLNPNANSCLDYDTGGASINPGLPVDIEPCSTNAPYQTWSLPELSTPPNLGQHIAVPAYLDTADTTSWNTLSGAGSQLGFAVVGAGNSSTSALRAKGTKIIGYVTTGFFGSQGAYAAGRQDATSWLAAIEQNIESMYASHNNALDGIFFDDATTTCGDGVNRTKYVDLFRELTQFVHAAHPGSITVANTNAAVPQCYENAADVLATFEGTGADYLNPASPKAPSPWQLAADPSKFWNIVYNVSQSDEAAIIAKSKQNNVGYLYLTDRSCQPYHVAPTPSYLGAAIAGANVTDTQTPVTPARPSASAVTATQVTLGWASAPTTAAVGYDVYANGAKIGSADNASTGPEQFTATGLSPATSYTFTVRSRDAAGTQSPDSSGTVVTTAPSGPAPSTPSMSSASSSNPTIATVSWVASGPVAPATLASYQVSVTNAQGGTQQLTLDPTTTTITIGNLTPSTAYSVTVAATDSTGAVSATSAPLSVTTPAPAITSPSITASPDKSTFTFSATYTRSYQFQRVFIDTDSNSMTGYSVQDPAGPFGADYLIENNVLYSFSGTDRNTWSWTKIASVAMTDSAATGQVSWQIPAADITVPGYSIGAMFDGSDGPPSNDYSDGTSLALGAGSTTCPSG